MAAADAMMAFYGIVCRLGGMQRKAVIVGGTGFLGQAVAAEFRGAGWGVVALGSKEMGRVREAVEGADAVINFAGKSIACVHTPANRKAIVESRVKSVRLVADAVRAASAAPRVWVQASSLAIYGNPGDVVCDEETPAAEAGGVFDTEVTREWEAALFAGECRARRVALRIGLVFGKDGGVLPQLVKLTKRFLGGKAGDGQQYLSWVHLEDFCRVCRWAVERESLAGPVNAGGPNPVTNEALMKELRAVLGRPWSPPVPAFAVKLGAPVFLHADGELALVGRRGVPRKLLESGFRFKHPELREALESLRL